MRYVIVLACFLVMPLTAMAQTQVFVDDYPTDKNRENFTASVDVRGEYFVQSTIPNRMLDDYSGYSHVAGEQMDLIVRSNLFWGITLDVEPYAWIGENQWISRIGLMGEARYETPVEWISVGYGHHSWHNIDVNAAKYYGHDQNWLLARFDLPKIDFDQRCWIRASFEPCWFSSNRAPILEKSTYGPGEENAFAMTAFPIVGGIYDFGFELKPYIQYGHIHHRCGVSGEFIYNFTDFVAGFISVDYYEVAGVNRDAIGIGMMLRLKR